MLVLTEEQVNKIVHDIVKVIGNLQIVLNDCPAKHCKERMIRYEKVLMGIREELLISIEENDKAKEEKI